MTREVHRDEMSQWVDGWIEEGRKAVRVKFMSSCVDKFRVRECRPEVLLLHHFQSNAIDPLIGGQGERSDIMSRYREGIELYVQESCKPAVSGRRRRALHLKEIRGH